MELQEQLVMELLILVAIMLELVLFGVELTLQEEVELELPEVELVE